MKKIVFFFLFIGLMIPFNGLASTLDSSKSSVVMDIDSGRVLYQKNPNDKRLIASITKIMTSVVAIENAKLNETYTAKDEILKMYGTSIYLEYKEKMTLKNLLYGLMLRSGNDASVVIANNVCKNEAAFVRLMNQKARELGMKSTTFSNPHGLDEKTQNYSSAYDMALLSSYAYKHHAIYRKITKTKKYETSTKNKSYLWYNRNKLLGDYEYCTGGKNGYTPSAGRTLVTTAEKNGLRLTVVTLNDSNEYVTHKNLYEFIYRKYQNYKIIDHENFHIDKTFFKGDLYLKKSFIYPLKEEERDLVKTVMKITKTKGYKNNQKVGNIEVFLNDKKIGSVAIYAKK